MSTTPDDSDGVLRHQDEADPGDEAVRDHLGELEENVTGDRFVPDGAGRHGPAPAEASDSGARPEAAPAEPGDLRGVPDHLSDAVSDHGSTDVDPARPIDSDAPAPARPPTDPHR